MKLENNQSLHNQALTAIGNNSASNDFRQHKHDMNGKLMADARAMNNASLIESAGHFAAGRKLGLEDGITLELMARKAQRGF